MKVDLALHDVLWNLVHFNSLSDIVTHKFYKLNVLNSLKCCSQAPLSWTLKFLFSGNKIRYPAQARRLQFNILFPNCREYWYVTFRFFLKTFDSTTIFSLGILSISKCFNFYASSIINQLSIAGSILESQPITVFPISSIT